MNLLRRSVDVVESLAEVKGRLITGPTKTRARRTISLPRFLADMLNQHLREFASPKGYVFMST